VIAVVDYGVNNVKSVVRALLAGGHAAELTAEPEVVRRADRVLLPGVGNFGQGTTNLRRSGLADAVRDAAVAGRPVMGICLGLQLCLARSDEAPEAHGLGLLPGRVRKLDVSLPVPHVGWAEVRPTGAGRSHPMLQDLNGGEFFYHVHSYHPADLPDHAVLATADYGYAFPTIVGQGNVVGAQFHPEKSQRAGIELLSAFARWTP
jgi:imidazole glycerol phosphate synthase glutamine amidotransferase subunit